MLDAAYASDIATLRLGQGKLAQDKVAQAGLAGAGETRDRAAAREAAENFEAVFVSQMVSHMFAGIQEDSLFGGGQAGDLFGSMLHDEYGRALAKSGGVGLADQVMRQILKLQEEIGRAHV